jgi:lysophospholipase L1-like esterase
MRSSYLAFCVTALVLPLVLTAMPPASAQTTYVAIGDSLAYGYQNDTLTPVGNAGSAGYAQPYAAFLSAQAGTPIQLLDLGIVGETTDSLLNNSTDNALLNSNYSAASPTSQYDLLSSDLNSNVSNVTVQVGANDILGLATSDAFQMAVLTNDTAAEQLLLTQTLTSIAGNYDTLLTRIDTLTPNADVQVLGYYNPYAALPPTSPINVYLQEVSAPLMQGLNGVLEQEAAAHNAQYVDLASPFAGHEDTLVRTGDLLDIDGELVPNDHPTDAGYAVITQQLETQPVPEASTPVSFGLLLGFGVVLLAVRRRVCPQAGRQTDSNG